MFQNYMDYTNDACMNLITQGQVSRMDVVLANSPRRKSLTTSPGLLDPIVVVNDLGIRSIVTPGSQLCPGMSTPNLEVRNYGTGMVTSTQIRLFKNDVEVETKNFTLSLNQLESTTVSFTPVSNAAGSTSEYKFEILQTNGTTDDNSLNNKDSINTTTPQQTSLPIAELFNTIPATWEIQNPDGLQTWTLRTAPGNSPTNQAMFVNFYDYEEIGALDRLVTPVFDLSSATTPVIKFDRAYARYPGGELDELSILVSLDCGADLSLATEVFKKSGTALSTAPTTAVSFTPSGASQWVTETIPLTGFIGQPNVQIIFVAKNDYGNNLYLDNVLVLSDETTDLTITSVLEPSPLFCNPSPTPIIEVQNLGSTIITSFKTITTINGTSQPPQLFTGQNLIPGETIQVTLNTTQLTNGENNIMFAVSEPNLGTDDNPANDFILMKQIVNASTDKIPLREDFDSDFSDSWIFVSQNIEEIWKPESTNKGTSPSYPAFTNSNIGQQSWLVSPVLDFSTAQEGGLFFDLSYGKRSPGSERLTIMASTDCGITYSDVLYDLTGDQFATASSTQSWIPADDSQWRREYINVNLLAGEPQARLAFVVTNDYGNNLYIDNIEIYNDDNPFPAEIESSYMVYSSSTSSNQFKITFNLPQRQTVRIQLYSMSGQIMLDSDFIDTLNQTYTLDLSEQNSGLYIVRVFTENEVGSTKIFSAR
ncbi:MAG: T9SS type A sorting domain-containing protein [Flammeovirgaceae bacterium]|nr:T9SS type A sorting domain-containing protein [Flammeovirgaceae bacterium]